MLANGDIELKRLYANRPGWHRVTKRRFFLSHLDTPEYRGYVTLLCIDGVLRPLWKELDGRRICIVDAGFSWLQHFPANKHYAVTTMFDAGGQIVQWYIDICKEHGVGDHNIPWKTEPTVRAEMVQGFRQDKHKYYALFQSCMPQLETVVARVKELDPKLVDLE